MLLLLLLYKREKWEMMLEKWFAVVEKGTWEGYWFSVGPGPHQSPPSGSR